MYQERIEFNLRRTDEGESETIHVSFDAQNMDIHEVLKKFGGFLLSLTYAPEAIQRGFDEFDIEAI